MAGSLMKSDPMTSVSLLLSFYKYISISTSNAIKLFSHIYLSLNADDLELARIDRAVSDYNNLTNGCVQWIPRTDETDYVYITSAFSGCFSSVGMVGGAQQINYERPGCIDQ